MLPTGISAEEKQNVSVATVIMEQLIKVLAIADNWQVKCIKEMASVIL